MGLECVNFEKSPVASCGSSRPDSSGAANSIVDEADTRELKMNAMIKVMPTRATKVIEPSCAQRDETAMPISGSAV
jgi:hypothetical protein